LGDLERRVLEGLRGRLLVPESIAQFILEYSAERARLPGSRSALLLSLTRHMTETRSANRPSPLSVAL
jgi:hypothetical protein